MEGAALDVRAAVEVVQARLSGISSVSEDPGSSEEERARKQRAVLRELDGLDLSLSFEEVKTIMEQRVREARGASIEYVVAWEIEEELSLVSSESAAVPGALAKLEKRLDEVESWLAANHEDLEGLKAGMDELVKENAAIDVQRQNLAKLGSSLEKLVCPNEGLALGAGVEDALRDPAKHRPQVVASAVEALRTAIDRAGKLRGQLRAVDEREEHLSELRDAFAAAAERHARRKVERLARTQEVASLDAMNAGALRSSLRHRQRELHAAVKTDLGPLLEALGSLGRRDSLRRLRGAFAAATREKAYGPLLKAYARALAESSPSAALARALEDIAPFVADERDLSEKAFPSGGDDSLASQFADLGASLLAMVDAAEAVEAAALLAVVEDASRDSPAFLREIFDTLRQSATRKWTAFADQRCKWIASIDVLRKRDHASGPASTALEVVAFSDRLETVIQRVPKLAKTRALLSDAVAEPAYDRLASAFDDWLKRAVHADSKYGVVVALENNDFVAARLSSHARASPALKALAVRSSAKAADAIKQYADWMWAYEFTKLDAYFGKLQDLAAKRGISDAKAAAARESHRVTLSLVDDNLGKIFRRLDKHFPSGSRCDPNLRPKLRTALLDRFRAIWAKYDSISRAIFSVPFEPTTAQFDKLAKAHFP
ncbi:hypothetical protein CTAYLR_002757 [Chrysophaeum taylorii]|uniref:Uncharacterized protein n=1 Tax=Chrysophaeum taylorii TaxID=2483200 RepID=A0AAD7UBS1_9STRA|nr:hypothetical protein CTAYLR_002757 [Chrysophaeum taylorii]